MADDPNKTNDPNGSGDPAGNGDPDDKNPVPETWEEVFKHDRFKQLNQRAKDAEDQAKKLETQLEGLQKQLKDKEDAGKTELEKLQGQVSELTGKWEESQARALRLEVAQAQGIPVELVDRLQGSTREELTADAERMKAFLKDPEGKGVPPVPNKSGQPAKFDLKNKSPEEIRKAVKEGKVSFTQ